MCQTQTDGHGIAQPASRMVEGHFLGQWAAKIYMKLNVIAFSSDRFSWVKTDNGMKLIGEASDVRNLHLQPLYDDACDVGFAVSSTHTGEVVVYSLNNVVRDIEGDILYWTYTPTWESEREVPLCRGTTAKIVND